MSKITPWMNNPGGLAKQLKKRFLQAGCAFSLLFASQSVVAQSSYLVSGPTAGNLLRGTTTDATTTGGTNIHAFDAGGGAAVNSWSAAVPLPFAFDFYGTPVSDFTVSKNGLLTFTTALAGTTVASALNTNTTLPNASLPANTIAWYWGDFTTLESGDNIWMWTYGTAPNRQAWIMTYSYKLDALSFTYNAVVLEETTNKVYVVDMYNLNTTGGSFTLGVQKNATTAVLQGGPNKTLLNTGTASTDNDYFTFLPYTPGPNDVGITALVEPALTGCTNPAQDVTVTIKNYGTTTVSNIPVQVQVTGAATQTLTGTYTGSIAPNGTATFTLPATVNMNATGTYTFNATTQLAGDPTAANNALPAQTATRTFVATTSLPLNTVTFDGYTGANLTALFPGWTEGAGAGKPAGTTSAWLQSTASFPGNTTAKVNLYLGSKNEWIISPKFTATSSTALEFDAGITEYNNPGPDPEAMTGTDDAVRVMVTTNCGDTWTPIYTFNAANQPTNGSLSAYQVNLAAFAGQNIQVAFYATEGVDNAPDYDFHIDNLIVRNVPSVDVGISALVSPSTIGCRTASETVTVTIRNFGTTAVSNIPVQVMVGGAGSQTLTGTYTGTIAPGATANFTLPGTVNMLTAGTYFFDASTQLGTDGAAYNDALALQSRTVNPTRTLPLEILTFNSGTADFSGSNLSAIDPDWYESDLASIPNPSSSNWVAPSAGQITAFGRTAKINIASTIDREFIIGPRFVAASNTVVEFDAGIFEGAAATADPEGMTGTDDAFQVMVSTNCGVSFVPVRTFNSASPLSNGSMTLYTVNLGAYAGQSIIVALYATEGTVDDAAAYDILIDNVAIYNRIPKDAGVEALLLPTTGSGCYSSTETVQVTIHNYGSTALTSVPVQVIIDGATTATQVLNGTFTGSIAPGGNANFTLPVTANLSANDTYTFDAFTDVVGDANIANDSLNPKVAIQALTIAAYPYLQNFEGSTVGTPGTLNSGWTTTPATGFRWEVGDGPTSSTVTGPDVDHTLGTATGKYVFTEASSGVAGAEAILMSPCLDFSGISNPGLEYWYHMAGVDINVMHVEVFNGTTWVNVQTITGQQQTAEEDPWLMSSINLSAFSGMTVKVRFRVIRGASFEGDVAIDDVRIYSIPGQDAGVTALVTPTTDNCLGGAESITVTIKNYGASAISNVPVRVTTTGAGTQTLNGTYAGTIASGATANFTLPVTGNFNANGTYTVNAFTLLGTDGDTTNNAMSTVTLSRNVITALPYLQNFEGSTVVSGSPGTLNGGWTTDPATGFRWQLEDGLTSSTSTGPTVDHTLGTAAGKYIFTEASSGAEGDDAILMSPCIDLSSVAAPALEYWYHMFGVDIDEMNVEVFNGSAWVILETITGSQQTAETDAWRSSNINLSAYAGQIVKIRFRVTRGDSFEGDVAIDDVRIYNLPNEDVGITALVAPNALGCYGNAEDVTVRIRNNGAVIVSGVPVTVNVTGAVTQTLTGTFNGNIAPGATADFTLPATVNMSGAGNYNFSATTNLAGDANNANNTLAVQTRTTVAAVNLPLAAVTFTGFTGANLSTVHPGWTEGIGATLPAGTTSGWLASNATQQTALGGVTAKINLYLAAKRDWIVGPKFVPTANTRLSYEVAVTDFANADPAVMGSDDRVSVMISTDCGATFTSIKDYTAADALSNQLSYNSISLGAYAGQPVIIAFFATEGATDNLEDYDFHLDNIQVSNSVIPPLSGTYAINKAVATGNGTTGTNAKNFRTFTDAMNALNERGVSGNVVFNVTANSGPYTERVYISNVVYAPAVANTATITINGNGNVVEAFIPRSTTAGLGVVTIDGTDRVTISGLAIQHSAGSSFGWGIHLINDAQNIVLQNNQITVNGTSTNKRDYMGIVATASYGQYNFPGNNVTNLSILNNQITGGYEGIRINGNPSSYSAGIIITGNTVTNAYKTGLYLQYLNAPVVGSATGTVAVPGNNVVTMRTGNPISQGIHLSLISGAVRVQRNKVSNAGLHGLYLLRINNNASGTAVIANNMIGGGFQNSVEAYGILLNDVDNAQVVFNSVNVDNANLGIALDVLKPYSNNLDIRNNSFAYTGGGAGYAMRIVTDSVLSQLNYNNYYSNGSNFVLYDRRNRPTLDSLRNTFGPTALVHDVNSKSGDPGYVSATNLHSAGTQLSNSGQAIAGITTEYDAVTVRTGNPDIGADERATGTRLMAASAAAGTLELSAYPNPVPAGASLSVRLTSAVSGVVAYQLTDLLGRVVLNKVSAVEAGTSTQTLEVSTLSKGLYILTVEQGAEKHQIKIVKE